MDFENTGLPNNLNVYKAYRFHMQMRDILNKDLQGVTVAKMLVEAGCRDEKTIIFALLYEMPDKVFTLMNERFGAWLGMKMGEADVYRQAHYEDVGDASDAVKLYFLAEHIMYIERTKTIPPLNDTFFSQILGTTSCPELENRYADLLFDLINNSKPFITEPEDTVDADNDNEEVEVEFPAFESLALLEHPAVRAAYKIISSDPRTREDAFEHGLLAAGVLCEVPEKKNPYVIAATLINTAIGEEPTEADIDEWRPSIGDEAADILLSGNVYSDDYERDIHDCAEGVAQMMLGYSIASVHLKYEDTVALMSLANRKPGLDPHLYQSEMLANNQDVLAVWRKAAPMIAYARAPELANELKLSVEETMHLIVSNMPTKPANPPKPKP